MYASKEIFSTRVTWTKSLASLCCQNCITATSQSYSGMINTANWITTESLLSNIWFSCVIGSSWYWKNCHLSLSGLSSCTTKHGVRLCLYCVHLFILLPFHLFYLQSLIVKCWSVLQVILQWTSWLRKYIKQDWRYLPLKCSIIIWLFIGLLYIY